MTKEQIKTQIDTDITNKTSTKSISPLNVGKNIKDTVDLIPEISYKVYTVILNQTSTTAPTAVILENTLGTITWTRSAAGNYDGVLTGGNSFTENKTRLIPDRQIIRTDAGGNNMGVYLLRISNNTVRLYTTLINTSSDDIIVDLNVEIRVYN